MALEDAVADGLGRHEPSTAASRLLSEMMVSVALAAASIKGEETLTLHYRGRTAGAVADCTAGGDLRGRVTPVDLSEVAFGPYVGELVTVKWLRGRELYRGVIPVGVPSASEMLEAYFGESEQWPARARVDVRIAPEGRVVRARGAFFTREPGWPDDDDPLRPVAERLSDPAAVDGLWSAMDEGRADDEVGAWLSSPALAEAESPLRYSCPCSREQVELLLMSLGARDLREWVREQADPHVVCEYCRQRYSFDAADVERLVAGLQGSLGSGDAAGA